MKRNLKYLTPVVVATVLGLSALAQQQVTDQPARNGAVPDQADVARPHGILNRGYLLGPSDKASEVIGLTVKDLAGEKLGKVTDLAVDLSSGRVIEVIVATGGVAGIGARHVAVPPAAFSLDRSARHLSLDATAERLKAAPEFQLDKWEEGFDQARVTEVYRYYKQDPYFARLNNGRPHAATDAPRFDRVTRASKLLGKPVKNLQDEKLGQVENLMVDLPAARVVSVVISSGGFLGIGDELSLVPPASLRLEGDQSVARLDTTKEQLVNAPHFKSGEWPRQDAEYMTRVYRSYRVDPYFTGNASPDADNTARNVRDRESGSLTPLDQGNSPEDRRTTVSIRKEILRQEGLSVNARNVKIITVNGRVTLRGPVGTEEEKRLIGEIATGVAQAANVDNQLEVKQGAVNR